MRTLPKCKKCGTKVSAKHVRICRKCFLANSIFKIVYCEDCGKQLTQDACYKGYTKCRSCAQTGKLNNQFGKCGKDHPTFKGGFESRKRFCLDCNKELNHTACYDGDKRCKSCARKEDYKNPENHPAWLGGLSRLPYTVEFNASLKESIRERDNHKCQHCGKTEEQEIKDYNKALAIHHIDYNKENCLPDNLISLCCECNTKANKNRDYWYSYFIELLTIGVS